MNITNVTLLFRKNTLKGGISAITEKDDIYSKNTIFLYYRISAEIPSD